MPPTSLPAPSSSCATSHLPISPLQDLWCYDFWVIHFVAAELRHMEQVAGRSLNPKIQTVARQIHFLQDCNISVGQGKAWGVGTLSGVVRGH